MFEVRVMDTKKKTIIISLTTIEDGSLQGVTGVEIDDTFNDREIVLSRTQAARMSLALSMFAKRARVEDEERDAEQETEE